jgi:hypothetical protein
MTRIHRTILTLLLLLAVAPAAPAGPYHGVQYGYNVTIPDNWTQIPADVVEATMKLAQNPSSKTTLVCDSAFQPAAEKKWFTYPYMIVQVIPYSSFGLRRQINEDEFAEVTKAMTGVEIGKAMDSALSPDARSIMSNASLGQPVLDRNKRRFLLPMNMTVAGIGKVKGMLAGHFGHDSLIQIGVYTRESDWDRYTSTTQGIIDSFHFDAAADYSTAAALASPSRNIWSGVAQKALAGGILGALIGGIGYAVSRFKKSKT